MYGGTVMMTMKHAWSVSLGTDFSNYLDNSSTRGEREKGRGGRK